MRPRRALAALLFALAPFIAADCADAASAASIDAAVDAAIPAIRAAAPGADDLFAQAAGVLIFPEVVKGGVLIGGQYGEGALRIGGETTAYYNTIAASYGLQIGGQIFGYALFFMDKAALGYLDESAGWDVGSAPTLVYGEEGWSGAVNLSQTQEKVLIVFFNQKGAMAGAGIQGAKISRIAPD